MSINLKTNGKLWKVFENKTSGTGKTVMLAIFRYMESDTNLITINGNTIIAIKNDTGMSESQIRNKVSELKKLHLIEATTIRGEYIVNPTLAIKGSSGKVWEMYSKIEQSLGDYNASIVRTDLIAIKAGKLTEEDYINIGKHYINNLAERGLYE